MSCCLSYISTSSDRSRPNMLRPISDEYRVIGIVDDPTRTLLDGLLLKAIPLNLDGLQLFIVLMGAFPPVFAALLR